MCIILFTYILKLVLGISAVLVSKRYLQISTIVMEIFLIILLEVGSSNKLLDWNTKNEQWTKN